MRPKQQLPGEARTRGQLPPRAGDRGLSGGAPGGGAVRREGSLILLMKLITF